MMWDNPIVEPDSDDREENFYKTIVVFLHYCIHDGVKDLPRKVTSEIVRDVNKIRERLLESDELALELKDDRVAEVLSKLPDSVIDNPFAEESVEEILFQIDTTYGHEFFRDLASSDPTTAWDHVNVGNAKWELGHSVEAVCHYDKAITLSPDLLVTYVHRARCLECLGRNTEALQDVDRVRESDSCRVEDFYEFAEAAEIAHRLRRTVWTVELVVRAVDLLLAHLDCARLEGDRILFQTESSRCYVYFDRIRRVIKLLKKIEDCGNSVVYLRSRIAITGVARIREKIGF